MDPETFFLTCAKVASGRRTLQHGEVCCALRQENVLGEYILCEPNWAK